MYFEQVCLNTCLYIQIVWFNQLPLPQCLQDGWCVEVLVEEIEVSTEDSGVEQSLF